MILLRQSTASQEVLLGPFLSDSDGKTAQTGLSIAATDIKLFVAGATSEASKNSGGATHIAAGRYYCVLDATDTATAGSGEINVVMSGALPVRRAFTVLPALVYDSLIAGSDNLQVDAVQLGGTNQTARDIGASVIAASVTGNVGGDVVGSVASVSGAVGSVTGNVGGNVTGSVGSVAGNVGGNVTGSVASVVGNVGGNVVGSVASVTAGVTVTTNNDKTGYSLTQAFPSNFSSLVISVGGLVSINTAQTLSAARLLDSVADTSLTINDALHCAAAGAAGKETVVSTTYTIMTPFTGTTLRTFTLDSATSPTSRT